MSRDQIQAAVQEHYGAVARGETSGCGCNDKVAAAKAIGYSEEEIRLAGNANLGLGCGNPLAMTQVGPGMTVLDLGSGAGFDAFLAWNKVGPTGKVIGVDMTDDMLARARENAVKLGASNVEFRKGQIEALPLEDNSVDFVISNCVINLSQDKPSVFHEIYRVLKPGGQFAVSDIVLLGDLPERVKREVSAYVGCISGASMMHDYIRYALEAGLSDLSIPQIVHGKQIASVLAPTGQQTGCCDSQTSCCGSNVGSVAASAVASIKLHGRKA